MGAPATALVEKEQTVDRVMRQWPDTIRAFLDYRMLCIGCPIGRMHTIEEACAAHEVDLRAFLEGLDRIARRSLPQLQPEDDVPSATSSSL